MTPNQKAEVTIDASKESIIQNDFNVSIADMILNKNRFPALIIPAGYYLITSNGPMSLVLLTVVAFAMHRFIPVNIRDKEKRIDYIVMYYADRYATRALRYIKKKIFDFMWW